MGLTDKLAEGRRRKLEEFLHEQLAEGERIEAALPMMQTHIGDYAGYYGVAVTPTRVVLVEWARGIPERPKQMVDSQPRGEISAEQKSGLLMSKIVLSNGGEQWVGLKVPRLHRSDADAVVAALSP